MNEKLIRIGRSADNDVVLHSAVVSRHHIELKRRGCRWVLFNLSSNGTFFEERSITQESVVDGMKIRLAPSGPQIHIQTTNINVIRQSQPQILPQTQSVSQRQTQPAAEIII